MELKVIYGIIALISALLIAAYCTLIKKKDVWFVMLYISVTVVNTGYFCMAVSGGLEGALMANRLSYLGSVMLPLCMMMIIMNVCKANRPKWMVALLIFISLAVFVIAASGGYTTWYYADVDVEFINGAAKLVKEYGPLHNIYYAYLFSYMIIMAIIILKASSATRDISKGHAMLLLCAVFGNIVIWLVEQMTTSDFEFLAVSYIITELLMLCLNGMLQGYAAMKGGENHSISVERLMAECPETEQLSRREWEVLLLMVEGKKRREILG